MKKFLVFISLVVLASMILASCTPKATVVPTEAPVVKTEAPVVTEVPTVPASTRRGGWADEIVASVVSSDQAVTQISADALDLYASGLSSADLPSIKDAGLAYTDQNGLYYDILYNPAVCADATVLNPFSSRRIREATNYLFDRAYINQEVYNGGALEKFFSITTQFPDYADLADVAAKLEAKYAYNLDLAKQIITEEMTKFGATMNADGKWEFSGKPVTLIGLIRPDSDGTRKPIGDYVANQFEAAGFTVDRQYKKSSEASPLWRKADMNTCVFNWYTAAWSSTILQRDQKTTWQEMFLPDSVQGEKFLMANVPDPEFQKLGDDLANGIYKDLTERHNMMARAMELSMEDSIQVWLIDGKNYCPHKTDLIVTADLAAGVEGAQIWPMNIRWDGREGGTIRYATNDLFTEPWEAMRQVVENQRGTAHRALTGLGGIPIAGKTGTAQNPDIDPHAWFAGYTNAGMTNKPDIAIVVFIENGGEGSEKAAPVFRRIIESYFGMTFSLYPWESKIYTTQTPTIEGTPTP